MLDSANLIHAGVAVRDKRDVYKSAERLPQSQNGGKKPMTITQELLHENIAEILPKAGSANEAVIVTEKIAAATGDMSKKLERMYNMMAVDSKPNTGNINPDVLATDTGDKTAAYIATKIAGYKTIIDQLNSDSKDETPGWLM